MKLPDKLVNDFISEEIGKDVLAVFELLKGKKKISEFKLAEKMQLTVNQVRNMLYRLYSFSLVDFTRKKDKKKGWYIYYWDLNTRRIIESSINFKEKKLENLKNILKREEGTQYFISPDKSVRMNFQEALEHDFKDPETEEVLVQDDNSRRVQALKRTIDELEKELEEARKIEIKSEEEPEPKKKKESKSKKEIKKKEKTIKKVKKAVKKKTLRKRKEVKKKPTSKKTSNKPKRKINKVVKKIKKIVKNVSKKNYSVE